MKFLIAGLITVLFSSLAFSCPDGTKCIKPDTRKRQSLEEIAGEKIKLLYSVYNEKVAITIGKKRCDGEMDTISICEIDVGAQFDGDGTPDNWVVYFKYGTFKGLMAKEN